jgi:cystine transport system substrate-binding protein
MVAEWILVIVTAYCPGACCCGPHADGKTATGRDADRAGVAVDPSIIPLGSRLDIPGYSRGSTRVKGSWILADDTGGVIKGRKIDIRFSTHEEARAWGKRTLKVRVWKKSEKVPEKSR